MTAISAIQQNATDLLRSDAAELATWILKDYAVKLRDEKSSSEDLRKGAELVSKLLGMDAKDRAEAQPTFNVTISGGSMRIDVTAPKAPADLEQVEDVTDVTAALPTPKSPVVLNLPEMTPLARDEVDDMLNSMDNL